MVKKRMNIYVEEDVLLALNHMSQRLKISKGQLLEWCIIESLPKILRRVGGCLK